MLLSAQKLSRHDLERALEVQRSMGGKLGRLLVSLGLVAEADVFAALARQADLPLLRADAFPAERPETPALNTGFLLAHNLLPLGPALEGAEPPAFASADPRSETLRSALRLVFGAVPTLVFGLETEIAGRLNEWYVQAAQEDEEAVPGGAEASEFIEHLRDMASEAPIIQRVNQILAHAVTSKASDIHIETYAQKSVARIRVAGLGGRFGEAGGDFGGAGGGIGGAGEGIGGAGEGIGGAGGAPKRGSSPGSSPALADDTGPGAPTYRPGMPAETAAKRRAPRLVVFPTVTTHAPFAAIPPLREDWSRLLRADAFHREEVDAAEGQPVSWTEPLPAYLASMRYQFGWLADYLARHAAQDLVMIVIGDHQPVGTVSGPPQPRAAPGHVIAADPALLARFEAAGFIAGLTPPQQPLGPMHVLTQLLANAFSSPPRDTPRRNAPP